MTEATATKPDRLIMSVRLASGDFESSVSIRMDASEAEKMSAIERWLKLAHTGLQIGATNIVADLSKAEARPS